MGRLVHERFLAVTDLGECGKNAGGTRTPPTVAIEDMYKCRREKTIAEPR